MMHDQGFWGMNWGMGWGWIVWIILLGVGVWLAVALLRNPDRSHHRDHSAQEILKERYARGEISREEYQQKLHDLTS